MSIELARLDATQFREVIREREREGFTTPNLDAATLLRLEALFGRTISAQDAVREIVADVRGRGDIALREWTSRIDGVDVSTAQVWAAAVRGGRSAPEWGV